jgi:hypothetical protein
VGSGDVPLDLPRSQTLLFVCVCSLSVNMLHTRQGIPCQTKLEWPIWCFVACGQPWWQDVRPHTHNASSSAQQSATRREDESKAIGQFTQPLYFFLLPPPPLSCLLPLCSFRP